MSRRKTVKNLVIGLLVSAFFLTACGGTSPAAQLTPDSAVVQTTPTPSPLPTATRTLLPSATPTASVTPLPAIPTFTPTFDVSTIVTVTPAPKAECPKETIEQPFSPNNLNGQGNDYNQQFINYTLAYLNSGGPVKTIRATYPNPVENVQQEDVTGDGINEVIFAFGIWIDIFKCMNGKYELSTISTMYSAQGSKIIGIVDINMDGVKEIIAYFDGCMGSRCPSIDVLGWDGKQFKSLIENPSSMGEGCSYMNIAPFQVEVRDIDNNGTIEIILQNVDNPWPDDLDFPFRKETRICMWNGKSIALYQIHFDKPYYRFQALQDGEMATKSGNYLAALDSYNQTIDKVDLEWFTKERLYHDFWIYHSNYFSSLNEPTPTASPSMRPDPAEYPRLAAYAYYRIMLLHLVQGQDSDATAVYTILGEKFGNDPYARPYLEMASAFWEAYQPAHSVYDGCAAAIQYAAEHPEILTPLGSDYHGAQSHIYVPADVCPFR
jgi:hypothetical protein